MPTAPPNDLTDPDVWLAAHPDQKTAAPVPDQSPTLTDPDVWLAAQSHKASTKTGWEPVDPKELDPWAPDTAMPRADNPYGKTVMDNVAGAITDLKSKRPLGPPVAGQESDWKDGTPRRYAGAAHKLITAAGVAASPLLLEPLVTAPLATVAGMGLGTLGSAGARAAGKLFGLSDDQADLAGDAGGLAAGYGTSTLAKALGRWTARGFANSALGTTAKTREFGTDPGKQMLAETWGLKPSTTAESARQRIADIMRVHEVRVAQGNDVPLSGPRGAVQSGRTAAVKTNDPTLYSETEPMVNTLDRNFLTDEPYPAVVPASKALDLRRGFGNQHVRWVQGRTTKANEIAKAAYGQLTDAIHDAAPGTAELDDRVHNLIPVRDLAMKADLTAGPIEAGINRATRPTGGLMPAVKAFYHNGPTGAATILAAQELLSSPGVKTAIARGIYRGVGGPRLSAPELPMRQIPGIPDPSGFAPPWITALRNVGNEASPFAPTTKMLPAATSGIGVSGTIVPDIIGRSSRGMGTPIPLIEAAERGTPSVGTVQDRRFGSPTRGATPGRGGVPLSDVAGPGAATVGPKTPIPLGPVTTPKNPYR